MVIQYPYTLEKLVKTEAGYNPETGEYLSASDHWVFVSNCRDDEGSGRREVTEDGEVYTFTTLIQLPRGTDGIKSGDKVRVTEGCGRVRFDGSVVKFRRDQFHSRIWA